MDKAQRDDFAALFRDLKKTNEPGGDLAAVVDVLPQDHSKLVWGVLRNAGGMTLGGLEEFVGDVPPAEAVLDIIRRKTVKSYTYQLSPRLIRGSRPSPEKLSDLHHRYGVRATINLCVEMHHGDDEEIAAAGLVGEMKSEHIPLLDNGRPTFAQVFQFFQFLAYPSNIPAYVHCEQGVGRTGVMAACYRVGFNDWPTDMAIKEQENFCDTVENQLEFVNEFGAALADPRHPWGQVFRDAGYPQNPPEEPRGIDPDARRDNCLDPTPTGPA